jgi:hypothetical protein
MSNASNLDHRELTDTELDAVSGGSTSGGNVVGGWDMATSGGPIGPTTGPGGNPGPAIDAWNKCLGVFGY